MTKGAGTTGQGALGEDALRDPGIEGGERRRVFPAASAAFVAIGRIDYAASVQTSTVFRASALFLLTFAAIDLLVPGLCFAEPWAGEPASVDAGPVPSLAAQPGDAGYGDDCFCCCAHIVPRQRLDFRRVLDDATSVVEAPPTLLVVRTAGLYHPPRAS